MSIRRCAVVQGGFLLLLASTPVLADYQFAADGSNFVATFTVTEGPLPDPITENGKVIVSFAHTTNTGFGNELFIVGNHPDVGSWDPLFARKLYWTGGNAWTGRVAVQAGHALEYKYIVRTNSAEAFCDAGNVQWMPGANLPAFIPPGPDAPYDSKAIYYYSGWTNADHTISLGMMRETIIVAVDNSTNRSREYIPPGDDAGAGPGLADQYGRLIVEYVKPMIDSTYRTLTNRDNLFLQDGYAVNHDLCFVVGCGHAHNEGAWDQRLPGAYAFLLNILDEPNLLAQSENPPVLDLQAGAPGTVGVSIDTLKGRRYRLERAADMAAPQWQGVVTSATERFMWSATTLSDTSSPAGEAFFYRVNTMPWP